MLLHCLECGEDIAEKRARLGYTTCLPCGEKIASQKKHCVVPMHKSAYMAVTDRALLKCLNKYAQEN